MDESTNNTDTPETKAAAVVETTPTPAKRSQDPQQAQLTLGMTPDQVAAHTSAVARAIEAEAKLKAAHKAKEAEAAAKESESASVKAVKAEERLNTLEASNKNLMDQVRRAKALEVLPGLKDPATFLPLVDELVVLDENHALTEASCTAIASWQRNGNTSSSLWLASRLPPRRRPATSPRTVPLPVRRIECFNKSA